MPWSWFRYTEDWLKFADRVTRVPKPQRLADRMKRNAKSLARKGLDKAPWAAQVARSAYFSALNWRRTQQLAYEMWLRARDAENTQLSLANSPTISVVLDVAGQGTQAVERAIARVIAQSFTNWVLVIVSDAPISEFTTRDRVDRLVVIPDSTHAERVNAVLADCEGDFIAVVGPDDVLYPETFTVLATCWDAEPDADILYGGEDIAQISRSRTGAELVSRRDPFFKPGWNPELLHSMAYLGNITLFRTSQVVAADGLRDMPGGELWDLALRLTRGGAKVAHTAGIVAGRVADAAPVPDNTAKKLLEAALAAEGYPTCTVVPGQLRGTWSIRYPIVGQPLVSIVIPSRNAFDVVRRCIESIYASTSYESFEVVLVDTGSDDPEVLRWYDEIAARHESFRVIEWPEKPFSYARSCNAGEEAARGEILVMLNNDTEVLEPTWLEALVAEAQRPEIGLVGCLLLYPDRLTVQHAGIGLGIKTVAGNSLSGLRLDGHLTRTQELMLRTRRATTAVTAACVAVRKTTYDQVGGFDPQLRITFNDVDLSLRIAQLGYRNLYTPDVRLLHHESKTIAPTRDWTELFAAADLFRSRWATVIADDPQFNSNLARTTTSYRLPFRGR